MAVRSSVNQKVQLGVESVHGTTVPANKLLTAFTWTAGGDPATKQFRGTGRQYPSASALLYKMSKGTISGPGDFAQILYPLSSLWGAPTAAAHSPSLTAYDNVWTPGLTGSYGANAKSFTLQMGDAVDAEQYGFVVFTGFGYSFTRKQEVTISGEFIAQDFTDGATLTSNPTEVAQNPMTGAQVNVYLDATSAGIGGTQLTDFLKGEFKASDYYDGYYPVNRANSSFSDLVDKEKKHELTLEIQANSTGVGLKGTYLETGARCYVRVDVQGPVIDAGNSVHASMQHDMACFVSKVDPFSDVDGVYAVKYTLTIAEDVAWSSGTAQKMTLTNLLNGLA